ncbi:hypothetical protein GQ457_02G023400 [Hibiscus cannabinus]
MGFKDNICTTIIFTLDILKCGTLRVKIDLVDGRRQREQRGDEEVVMAEAYYAQKSFEEEMWMKNMGNGLGLKI